MIYPEDIYQFLKFIDRYPSTVVTIQNLEFALIEYFERNNISINEEIKNICERYEFKYLYLHMHIKNQYDYEYFGSKFSDDD